MARKKAGKRATKKAVVKRKVGKKASKKKVVAVEETEE